MSDSRHSQRQRARRHRAFKRLAEEDFYGLGEPAPRSLRRERSRRKLKPGPVRHRRKRDRSDGEG